MSTMTLEQVRDVLEYVRSACYTLEDGSRVYCGDMADSIAALLRERESAKAAVTDEMVATFVEKVAVILSGAPFPSARSYAKAREISDLMLEAVAPMLASARVPGGWQLVPVEATDEMCEAAWESDASDYVGEHHRIHRADLAYKAMLAAAPKPETEE